ncbi:MAG: UDP-N-acetylmuramoyl-L-alanine--D-glutamate ligase [Kiritimatiellia bacterium]
MEIHEDIKALVLGGGVSGEAAALLLSEHGCRVTIADEGNMQELADKFRHILSAGGRIAAGTEFLPEENFDLCVASPAFAPDHPWILECQRRGVGIISELELGARFWKGKILAVTGSKGKSSIVKFCADTISLAGGTASPAGNYGIPLSRFALRQQNLQWAVTEVSSFQMENTGNFRPDIAVLLNVQPDHLNRHGNMQTYQALKMKIFAEMSPASLALVHENVIVNDDFPHQVELVRFGSAPACPWYWSEGCVRGRVNGVGISISLESSWFDNPVFGPSAAAACGALTEAGLTVPQIEKGLREFVPLEHRMEEFFTSRKGVIFVNDSKATTLTALFAAVKMIKTPIRLIAGGILKEKVSENPKELLTQGVKKVYLIGDCCEQMYRAWSDKVLCMQCGTLERAVRIAVGDAGTGETVLLSPGTASFDQFSNYCERGEHFKDLVREVAD